jgi:hypothetical protein
MLRVHTPPQSGETKGIYPEQIPYLNNHTPPDRRFEFCGKVD